MSVAENGGIVEIHHIPCLLSYIYIYCVVPPSQEQWEMKVYRGPRVKKYNAGGDWHPGQWDNPTYTIDWPSTSNLHSIRKQN